MTDQVAIIAVVVLALLFFGLWSFNAKQKRKFEDDKRQRRLARELKQMKTQSQSKPNPQSETE